MEEEKKEEYRESYAKKWLTPKYIIAYVILAVVVYGLVYYFFFANKGGYTPSSGYKYNQPAVQISPTTNATPTEAMTAKSWVVSLAAENASGESGTATLTEENGKTTVVLDLAGEPAATSQPAHIHVGACPGVGAVKYPLTSVVDGKSATVLDVTIDQLKSMLPLAINVHKSASQVSVYVSCGELKAGT